MRKAVFLFLMLLVFSSCATGQKAGDLSIRGTVKHVPFEGGFYGIEGDDGTHYDPVFLPEEFRRDGMRVKFRAKENDSLVSYHMWGLYVEILEIKKA